MTNQVDSQSPEIYKNDQITVRKNGNIYRKIRPINIDQ